MTSKFVFRTNLNHFFLHSLTFWRASNVCVHDIFNGYEIEWELIAHETRFSKLFRYIQCARQQTKLVFEHFHLMIKL